MDFTFLKTSDTYEHIYQDFSDAILDSEDIIIGDKDKNLPVTSSILNLEAFEPSHQGPNDRIILTPFADGMDTSVMDYSSQLEEVNPDIRVFGMSKLARGIHNNPDFCTLSCAEYGLAVSQNIKKWNNRRILAFLSTKKGLVNRPLEINPLFNLFPNIHIPTNEGLVLKNCDRDDWPFHEALQELCAVWNFTGFMFVVLDDRGEGKSPRLYRISPVAPMGFWRSFIKGFRGNLAKLIWKAFTSRRSISELKFEDTVAVKVTLPPYPYTICPWISNDRTREQVESWMREGARNRVLPADTGLMLKDVALVHPEGAPEASLVSTGPELGFAVGSEESAIQEVLQNLGRALPIQHKHVDPVWFAGVVPKKVKKKSKKVTKILEPIV